MRHTNRRQRVNNEEIFRLRYTPLKMTYKYNPHFSVFTFHLHSTHNPHQPLKTKQQPSQIISVKKAKILVFKFFVRIFATDLCYFCNKLINIYIN